MKFPGCLDDFGADAGPKATAGRRVQPDRSAGSALFAFIDQAAKLEPQKRNRFLTMRRMY